jgi:N-acyl-D-amino-acid deacylase
MFDIVIGGGTVVDGTEAPASRADVGISGDRIQAIGDLSRSETRRFIDATGLTVSPGFIDTHTHSEGDLLVNPQHANGLRQGITTELLGIDGMSYAPLSPGNYLTYRHWLSGLLGDPPEDLDMSSVAAFRANYHEKVAINTAYLVPNGTVRLEVLGFHDLPLAGQAMEDAKRLVQEGIEQGAAGFSTGSSYYPGPWSSTDELVEICEVVRDAGGVYMCEPRRANPERAFGAGGVAEALEIARRSGVRLHLAHYRTDPKTAGKVQEHMELVDQAKAEGVDVTLDIYPYPSGSTIPISFLPSYAQSGGPEAILRRLRDPVERKRIVGYLETEFYYYRSLDEMVFSYLPGNEELEGMSVPDIAAERGVSMGEVICDLLLEENLRVGYTMPPPASVALWRRVSRDSMELLARPDYMVCSDITPAGSMCHPRSYGAFPRFLGRLRRQFGGISLEGMVHRMTDRPARRFGLEGRGRIEKGYYADVTVFDAEHVIDTATYDDPRQFPIGIPYVLVNGRVAVDSERCTGVMAGRAVP